MALCLAGPVDLRRILGTMLDCRKFLQFFYAIAQRRSETVGKFYNSPIRDRPLSGKSLESAKFPEMHMLA
jgi:hypothetical protein